jgi:hypothetical protein
MTTTQFFCGSGGIAWVVLTVLAVRAIRHGIEQLRNLRRRLAWALWGWTRPRFRYF